MALQDLTPQLRTRLSKVERAVGWFVILAALLLLAGFSYYAWHTAERKGWFIPKARYFTLVKSGAGLKVGDPVKLMGFDVGEITFVEAQPPDDQYYNVFIQFTIKRPYYGYLWTDSRARIVSELLGSRYLEVTKGVDGTPSYQITNDRPVAVWSLKRKEYVPLDLHVAQDEKDRDLIKKGFWLDALEAASLHERAAELLSQVEAALPDVLALTNRLGRILDEGIAAADNANRLVIATRPVVDNLEQITGQLRDPHGSLGEWLIPTNLQQQLTNTLSTANSTLLSANSTLTNTDAQITALATELGRALENLSAITSNLNAQVAANTNLVTQISDIIVHADELVQGLKRHWLLRSAFKSKEDRPATTPSPVLRRGKTPQ